MTAYAIPLLALFVVFLHCLIVAFGPARKAEGWTEAVSRAVFAAVALACLWAGIHLTRPE